MPDTCVGAMGIGRDANQENGHIWRKASRKRGDLEETKGRDLREAHIIMQMSYKFKCLIIGIQKETPREILLQLQGHVIYDALFRLGEPWHRACFHRMLMSDNCYHK